jgi:hypothetical protein
VRRSDRLLSLSTCRLALQSARLESPEAVRSATPEQFTELRTHRAEIVRLVKNGNPDVLAALFGPLDWAAAALSHPEGGRLLSVRRGKELIISLVYSPDDEREAWAALKSAFRSEPQLQAGESVPGVPRSSRADADP